MKEYPVESRLIESIFFDSRDGKLYLRLEGGRERLFTGVPEAEVAEMSRSHSPGKFYVNRIRNCYPRLSA
jgi:hypothetical protein